MASQSPASISSCPGRPQLLVRLLVLLVVVLGLAGAAAGSVAVGNRTSTLSAPEADDSSSSSVEKLAELLEEEEEESFEQDVVPGAGERANRSSGERETSVTEMAPGEETSTLGYNAVATTPKIVPVVKNLSRYEQGLEDYDEAADRAEREQQQQAAEEQQQQQQQQYNSMLKPMLTLFNVISTVLSSGRSMRSAAATDGSNKTGNITFGAGKSTSGADNENETTTAVTGGRYIKGDPLNGYYDFVISEGSYKFWVVFQLFTAGIVLYATFAAIYYSKVSPLTSDYDYIDYLNGARSFAGGRSMGAPPGSAGSSTVWDSVANALAAVEGRYIKGDPLNGYYDFVISEGSYKFWAVFQLVTAAVVIYSTLTAIYYSKVAPLTSDYDYIDYLNGGRSFAGARPVDASPRRDPGGSGRGARKAASGWSWDRLSTSAWFGPAAQAFTVVMDAIERQPK